MSRYFEMQVFVRAAEDGSFSAAARNLALTPSAVSKLIARMEDRLGVLLFRRTYRSIQLTQEGEAFYQAALTAIEAVESADAAVFSGMAAQQTLRIRSMPIIGQTVLAAKVAEFSLQHPNLSVEMLLRIDSTHLLDDGVDIAIHVGHMKDSSLVAMPFSSTRWIICASPSYLAQHGTPSHPDDLANHACVNFVSSIAASLWMVRSGEHMAKPLQVKSRIVSNQASVLIEFARAGLGIARLTEVQVADDLAQGRLIELFPKHQCHEEDPIIAVYQSRRHLSSRIRAFIGFLRTAFPDPPAWRHWRKGDNSTLPMS
ncbi:LysR family transcriptional regulator [Actimicrobium sp. CCI2.3]|uniref:LysR family transcriptional regulator n=1 Tax=Actimicrobium sp. CCI2.3 TaxID=3048616 RepID=UPI002AB58DC1|nr:LysR family transcriptional regulator [Actimicrobium sp. CCI2.3]MDY7573065.1 LysR family transcriptional regulator [Actimicrobium sp. CCI2.3]MEB0020862.1 LysR family transcriptional regulator [Actimicrobium sp. CCI2.3]